MLVVPVSAADSCSLLTDTDFHFYWGRKPALLYCSLELESTTVSKFICAHHRSQVLPPAKLGTYKLPRCKKPKKSKLLFKDREDICSSVSLINVMQLILSGRMKNRVERMKANVTGEHASLGKVCPLKMEDIPRGKR